MCKLSIALNLPLFIADMFCVTKGIETEAYTTSSRVVVVNFLVGLLHALGPRGFSLTFLRYFLDRFQL